MSELNVSVRSAGCVFLMGGMKKERGIAVEWGGEGLCESRASWSGKENVPSQAKECACPRDSTLFPPFIYFARIARRPGAQSCFLRT